ncbi:MAG: metallophosphatase [Desulfobacteraceae bacterium IS3]|nr:MAG: metallophosphatase [Desulfobacteraceae bacterium IS3]
MGNIFAIGDIHGSADKLIALMDKLDIDFENDTLVFVGDYIDRGPASFEVVEYLLNLKKRCRNTVFLKGNHEDMFLNYLEGPDKLTYMMNGGKDTLESYLKKSSENSELIPQQHIDFFKSLSLFHETEDYIFVHAGLRANIPMEKQEPDDLLWIRNEFIDSNYDFGKMVIFGHTPFLEPLIRPNKVGIDTGAVYGNKLTCLKLPDFKFYFE